MFHVIKKKSVKNMFLSNHQSLLAIICSINNYLFSIIFKTYIITSGDKNEYDMVPVKFKDKKKKMPYPEENT